MDYGRSDLGLTVLRASRMEELLPPLEALLKETQPANPLTPQTVIAAHPGMKAWLAGALARAAGPGRIVANLNVQLPSTWIDGLAGRLLGQQAVALPHYRRAHLRWTLHGLLGDPAAAGVTDRRVLDYLGSAKSQEERAVRHFQLADRLARVFSQYLVYRGQWLEAWEAGKFPYATIDLQAPALRDLEVACLGPLWKATVAKLGKHRGRLVQALSKELAETSASLPSLHVFGLSHLPPSELEVMRQYAARVPVFLYVPDPCRHYWGGLHAAAGEGRWRQPSVVQWEHYRHEESQVLADPESLDWRDQGHPLLARWGRMGQHFFASLVGSDVREDTRHWQDEVGFEPSNRLERLQESIRQLAPAMMAEDAGSSNALGDGSLRIHACHTRQRELEVLRDSLLDALDAEKVRPGSIVVMAPDIQAYLPLIPAVFGEPGSTKERRLPYHLADVPVARSHPLFGAFTGLLAMGSSRVTAPEVVDLLGVSEVRRALKLGEDEADTLVEWLRLSRVAWALDGGHKAALSLPSRAEHSFAWAMDRMLAGYVMGGEPGEDRVAHLPDGTVLLPQTGIDGPTANALGSLDRLLVELQAWRHLAQEQHLASKWAETLRQRVDAILKIDPTDADARAALSVIHRAISNLASEPAKNDEDPLLRLAVVREMLEDALAAAPERQRFLMGGVTFCGMVPQRAIPFDVVCVLGLNEGEFPRRPSDGGIDLMARLRRLGDRDVPTDDRYLFLETVMAARKRLHLSFIGQGVRDGKHRNPASPLAELMAELDLRCGNPPDDDKAPRPWLVRHPLQPFDQKYFDGSHPALFSYSRVFEGMVGRGDQRLAALRDGDLPPSEPVPNPVPLSSLTGYFKDPARSVLKEHLQVSLEALDSSSRLPDEEPMEGIGHEHSVARRVFLEDVLPRKCANPDWDWDAKPPAWIVHGGILPLGEEGREAWSEQASSVLALLACADASGRFDERAAAGGTSVRVDVVLADEANPGRLVGTVRGVFPIRGAGRGEQVVRAFPDPKDEKTRLKDPRKINFKDRVPAFLDWATLRLYRSAGEDSAPQPVRLTMLAAGEPDLAQQVNAWDAHYCASDLPVRFAMAQDLRRRVIALIELWRLGRDGLSRYYPKAGWEVVNASKGASKKGASPGKGAPAKGGTQSPEPAVEAPGGEDEAMALPSKTATSAPKSWAPAFGDGVGERDYAPGYARLLEGDLIFGDPETDASGRALEMLARDASQVEALIMLAGVDQESEE